LFHDKSTGLGIAPEIDLSISQYAAVRPQPSDPVLMRQFGVAHLFRLNNNENALGPPSGDSAPKEIPPCQDAGTWSGQRW